ncbi:MAG: type III pantothenate kinase [Clostridia bacterium]|nr:type III pantothenate kinase [Clostridia bacterium]
MIFTMDIGNTNIKTALFDGDRMVKYWRVSTNKIYTSDEYGILLCNLFAHEGISPSVVEGVIISSVVPTINFTIEHMCQNYFHVAPMFVVPGIKTGINIRYENPRELGSDRIANAVAAYEEYGAPCIFIDFGSATTFGVVAEGGAFLGGSIFPGVKLASEALVSGTAKLPRFELIRPETVIGRTTQTNLQSGMFYGYVGMVRNIVRKMKQELGREAMVVATGGMAVLFAEDAKCIDKLDGLLTLKGLRLIYERNKPEGACAK